MIYFIPSVLVLAAWSTILARKLAGDPHGRAWLTIAAATLHLGAASVVSSLFNQYTPPGFLIAQLVLVMLLPVVLRWIPSPDASAPQLSSRPSQRQFPIAVLISLAIAWFIGGVIVKQALLPVGGFDERMYHASRAAYWIQHQSVFWWETHNQRQVVFPFGSEMIFAWPLMMTRSEPIARTIFVLALPLAGYGAFCLARSLGAARTAALFATLIFVATPAVFRRSAGLKPDLWCAVYALGVAYWIVRAMRNRQIANFSIAMAGVFFVLAVNVKTTMLAMTPVIALLPLFIRPAKRIAVALGIGVAMALIFSGLLVTSVQNAIHAGHPLGPAPMRAVHTAEFSQQQLYTRTARLILFLIEPPFLPSDGAIQQWEQVTAGLIDRLNIHLLPGEAPGTWLEPFHLAARPLAENFSLAGIVWLPLLTVVAIVACRRLGKDHETAKSDMLIALLAFSLLGVALIVRWMVGIDRFLLPAYAVSVPIVIANVHTWLKPPFRTTVATGLVLLMIVPSFLAQFSALQGELTADYAWVDEPFMEVMPHLPPGSRIVLIAAQDTRDYPLFLPREHLANRVYSWGRGPIDLERLNRQLEAHQATHMLITSVPEVSFHWDPPADTTPAMQWAESHPAWREIPLQFSRHMRLYERRDAMDRSGGDQ